MDKQLKDFKVKCVEDRSSFTVKKVYEVKNGILTDDKGAKYSNYGRGYRNVYEINKELRSQFELVEESKMFTKSDLRTGDVVICKCGQLRKVLKGFNGKDIIVGDSGMWVDLEAFSDDLQISYDPDRTIMEVMRPEIESNALTFDEFLMKTIWQRIEPKKYTISEAQAKLSELEGKKVEIVKE